MSTSAYTLQEDVLINLKVLMKETFYASLSNMFPLRYRQCADKKAPQARHTQGVAKGVPINILWFNKEPLHLATDHVS